MTTSKRRKRRDDVSRSIPSLDVAKDAPIEYTLDPDFNWRVGFWQVIDGKFIDNKDNFREQLTTIIDSDESVHVGLGFRFGNTNHYTLRYFWEPDSTIVEK